MHNLIQSYKIISEQLRKISPSSSFIPQRRKPKLSDLELIALNLAAEQLRIDSENDLFKKLKKTFLAPLIERSVFNRRKRNLRFAIENLRLQMAQKFNETENYFIIDSMPLKICERARGRRSKICKEQENALPNWGFCATQDTSYYGYKLHAVCSISGVFQSIDFTPASVHDIHYLKT